MTEKLKTGFYNKCFKESKFEYKNLDTRQIVACNTDGKEIELIIEDNGILTIRSLNGRIKIYPEVSNKIAIKVVPLEDL